MNNRRSFFGSIAGGAGALFGVLLGRRTEAQESEEVYIGDMGGWREQSIRAYAHSEEDGPRSHEPYPIWRQGDKYATVHVHIGPHAFTINVEREGPCFAPRVDDGFYHVEVRRARDIWYNGHESEMLGRFKISAKPDAPTQAMIARAEREAPND